jgi:tetratricopeptide (TPR) repeat protein
VLALHPGHEAALYLRGHIALAEGDLHGALAYAQQGVQAAPRQPEAYLTLGQVHLRRGEVEPAEQAFRRAVALDPQGTRPRLQLAQWYYLTGAYPQARQQFEEVLAQQPQQAEARLGRARCLLRTGQGGEALHEGQRLLADGVKRPEVYFLLGEVYQEAGRAAEASQALDRALALAESVEQAQQVGDFQLGRGAAEEAVTAYLKATDLAPMQAEAYFRLGLAWTEAGRRAEVARAYQAALEVNPRHFMAANNLAWLYAQQPLRWEEAARWAEYALRLQPGHPLILDTCGWIAYQRGQTAKARRLLEEAQRHAPDNAYVAGHLGMVYARQGRDQEAQACLRQALSGDLPEAEKKQVQDALKQWGR